MSKNYRALTRTYRPQSFEDIVSQEHVSSTLKNAIKQNRLSHAYMFCGPRGVGKTTMARVLARTINSIGADVDGESLNQTLNIVEIDAASNNKVDDIHHLRETVRIPPQNGRYKVFIIDEVHMLSKQAFNALLKTLEEPPEHAIFIFATTEPHKVLPTILSRVQRFDFKRIAVDEIVSRLKDICRKEEIQIDEESLHVIAKKADGALRDALGLMDQAIAFCGSDIRYQELLEALNVVGHDQLFDFTAAVQERDSDKGLQLVDSLLKDGADIQEFLTSLTEHIRNMYVAVKSERMYLVDATADTKNRYKEAAQNFTEEDLMRMLHLVSDAQIKIRDVQQPRVHFEILLLKLVHMNRTQELSKLMGHLEELKKKDWNQPITQQEKSESPEVETPKESEPAQAQKTVAESTNGVSTSYSNTEQDEKPTTPQTSPEKSKGPESDPEPPTP
ncbi:MAG: DNA polymerase III subunit gamma/tau, partial [Balneolaceae bacterium]